MKIFLYSGTHWDREWYQCFQGFRHRLVEMADGLVNGLETDKDYGIFHFDGQTIVLEDILEIAPDLEERLGKLMQAGKIVIGPWYCMPDEVNVSGESLIRNLQIGKEICHKWGVEPSSNGYMCDIFGHVAQMPQILAGMNLHHTVLGRGTNEHTHTMHFRWQAMDGTDVTVYKLPEQEGYGDLLCHFPGDGETREEQVSSIAERIKPWTEYRLGRANIPVTMFLDAIDHNPWNPATTKYIDALKKLYPDAEVYHTNIMDMCDAVDAYHDSLPVFAGELNFTAREPGAYTHVITNTLSSRYPIKKANDTLETELEKVVAPLYAYGKAYSRDGFLKLSQKYLIMNHPHDSICGCSIDQVHRDMMYRFDQTRLLNVEILNRVRNAMRNGTFATPVSYGADSHDSKLIRIYNPLPYASHRTVTCDIHFEKNWGKYAEPFGYEGICKFKLFDKDGVELPYGITDIITYEHEDIYTVSFPADLLPTGVTDIEVRPSDRPTRYLDKLPTTATTAENDTIALAVNNDGSLTLTDKRTGITYPKLLSLVDDGEIGDGWFHGNPAIDRSVTGTVASIEKCENSVSRVTFKITQILRLPVEMDRVHYGIRRSEEYREELVVHYVTLYRHEKYLTVKTVVDNKALDHRLKLRLETGIRGKRYFAGSAFAVVERDTDADPDTADWKETASVEKAMNGLVYKRSEQGGLAFVAGIGLKECAVYENGIIDVTLLRCYRKTVGTHGEPDGQLVGTHEFTYAILPLTEEDTKASLVRLQDTLKAGLLHVTAYGKTGATYEGGLAMEGDSFVFSTANKLADGMEFRLFNCADETKTETVTLPAGAKTATLTEIDGRPLDTLDVTDGKIALTLGKWKIATVKVTF